MVQTYQCYFIEDGSFIHDGINVKLPTRRRTIVNVLDEEVEENTETSQADNSIKDRVERIEMILAASAEAEDDMTDEEWDEMLLLRPKTNAGLSRNVEI